MSAWARLQQAFVVLAGAGHLQPCLPAKDDGKRAKSTKAFNQAVMQWAQDSADLQFLASPVTGEAAVSSLPAAVPEGARRG